MTFPGAVDPRIRQVRIHLSDALECIYRARGETTGVGDLDVARTEIARALDCLREADGVLAYTAPLTDEDVAEIRIETRGDRW